jgi:hypothetical protein
MRDYALTQAIASESLGSSLAGLFRNWMARRRLAGNPRDDRFTSEDIDWALSLPLSVNPLVALEDRTFRRRHCGSSRT